MAYFSNSTDGSILDDQCANCIIGRHPDAACPVLLQQLLYNYDQLSEGQEKLRECIEIAIDKKGICQMKKVMDQYANTPIEDPAQTTLF